MYYTYMYGSVLVIPTYRVYDYAHVHYTCTCTHMYVHVHVGSAHPSLHLSWWSISCLGSP